jgi:hypothetical protein
MAACFWNCRPAAVRLVPALFRRKAAPELLFQRVDSRAHGRLRHVQPLRRTVEVAGGNDGEEGAGKLGFHRRLYIGKVDIIGHDISFVKCKRSANLMSLKAAAALIWE